MLDSTPTNMLLYLYYSIRTERIILVLKSLNNMRKPILTGKEFTHNIVKLDELFIIKKKKSMECGIRVFNKNKEI